MELANELDELANDCLAADSIADDVPVLSELFHTVRTGGRDARDGRYVALFDYDGEWSCRSVSFLQSGTHYRNTGADLELSFKPYPFCSVKMFRESIGNELHRKAMAARQSASNQAMV